MDSSVIDIGGGASLLVDALLADRRTDLTVLDVSEVALQHTQARLGARAADVAWSVADMTAWRPPRTWDVWHDRAVFHFLVGHSEQDAYLGSLHAGTKTGATAIVFTFALDGPERCSSLPVQRYSPATLAARVGPGFVLEGEGRVLHRTPTASEQRFSYAVLRRR